MSSAVAKRIHIDKFQALYTEIVTKETAKYAQPCVGGVYMGIVNVQLHNRIKDGVNICGDGRMHKMTRGNEKDWMDTKPKVCKYHKLEVKDRPDGIPPSIQFEFEFVIYKDYAYYLDGNTGYDAELEKGKNYKKIICIIELLCVDAIDVSEMTYSYNFHKITSMRIEQRPIDPQPTGQPPIEEAPSEEAATEMMLPYTEEIVTSLAQKNRYTFEFQRLNTHPKMPGLFVAESVGWPSDQLAVLFGGRARHGGLANMDFFFAQHKFDTTEWNKMKQIHTALANVLSKIEYMYNYLLANPEPNIDTPATRRFCQEVLDYITEPYIHEVLKRMVLITRKDAELDISEIRGVCEYVFQREYPFLDTLMWTYAGGTFKDTPVRDGMRAQLASKTRILAYDVVSDFMEVAGQENYNPILNYGKINAFSAHSVFSAYVSYAFMGKDIPLEFKNVLEDARQLLANMQRLKTSSNFALRCLRESCEIAAAKYSEFKLTSHYMIAASRVFITLLLQKDSSTDHEKFFDYIQSVAGKLRHNIHADTTNISTLEDSQIFKFKLEESMTWPRYQMDHVKFEYLVLATQLQALSGMRYDEDKQNYFRFLGE
jgi:hypothetical protein